MALYTLQLQWLDARAGVPQPQTNACRISVVVEGSVLNANVLDFRCAVALKKKR